LKGIVTTHPGVLSILFIDDTFSLDKEWFGQFCRLYKKEIGLPFGCFMRIEGIDEKFLTTFVEAGGHAIEFGVESGSEWLRQEVLGRRMTSQKMIDTFQLVHAFGIETGSLNMVGLPYETEQMAEETIQLNKKLKPSRLFATCFQPYPGTKLRELCEENGWLPEDAQFLDRGESILRLPTMTKEEIRTRTARLNEIGIELALDKHLLGHYDFLAHLGSAEVEVGPGGDVAVSNFSFTDDYVLKACPPARVTYQLHIPPRSLIDVAVGFHPDTLGSTNDGVAFIIEIEYGVNFEFRHRLFFQYVNPTRNPAARGWQEYELALDSYADQDVKISFITRPGPALVESWRCVGWRRPILTRLAPPVSVRRSRLNREGPTIKKTQCKAIS
jgi:hypothetical protein